MIAELSPSTRTAQRAHDRALHTVAHTVSHSVSCCTTQDKCPSGIVAHAELAKSTHPGETAHVPATGSRIEAVASTGVPVTTADGAMAARASTWPHGQSESKFLVVGYCTTYCTVK